MRKPSSRFGKVAAVLASPIAVVAAGALIWQSSYAAFSSTTRNSGDSWSTGTVALTDDDAGSAQFQVANMVPGQTETKCIKVTANTSGPGTVAAYALNPVRSAQGLEDRIFLSVETGTGGSFSSCDGFVPHSADVVASPLSSFFEINSYEASTASGTPAWPIAGGVAGGESRTFRVTWTFNTAGMTQLEQDALQGAKTGVDVQWELRTA